MHSPFPGMDPYIESSDRWGDFHTNMVSAMRWQLNEHLPARYAASVEEYVWIVGSRSRPSGRRVEPDVYVSEKPRRPKPPSRTGAAPTPTTIVLSWPAPKKRRHVRIIDKESNRVVTAIELLSPGNKESRTERRAYLRKRNDYLANRVSLVEIDLLRGGERLPLGEPPPELSDYYVMVSPFWEYPRAGLWPVSLRDPLPEIPVPLDRRVPTIPLALRTCLDRVYDESRYATELRYDKPLTPRPGKTDAKWVRSLLAVGVS